MKLWEQKMSLGEWAPSYWDEARPLYAGKDWRISPLCPDGILEDVE